MPRRARVLFDEVPTSDGVQVSFDYGKGLHVYGVFMNNEDFMGFIPRVAAYQI
jgi:hypothetical protein